MHFLDEEEVDAWYAAEKAKLDEKFMSDIDKDRENIPKEREQYEAALKKLVAKYQLECQKIVDKTFSKKKK